MISTLTYVDTYALESIRDFFYQDSPLFRAFILAMSDIEWIAMAIFLVVLWLVGTHRKDNTYKVQSLNIFYIIVGGFILYVILNQFLPTRVRPEMVTHLPPLVNHLPDNSFPSGHAIFAAASALGVHMILRNTTATLSIILLGILMNLTRIIAGVHFPGDILVGYIVGILGGYITYQFLDLSFFRKWLNPILLKIASYIKL